MTRTLAILMGIILVLNVPFGYWRANVRKFSTQWFIAVHVPVILTLVIRLALGFGYTLATFPFLVVAFFSGQYAGGRVKKWLQSIRPESSSSCLAMDLLHLKTGYRESGGDT